jgi:hypothetical protein
VELPRLQQATLAAYTRREGGEEYVLEASLTRDAMTAIGVLSPSSLPDLVSALAKATAIYELDNVSKLKAIKQPDWTKQNETT